MRGRTKKYPRLTVPVDERKRRLVGNLYITDVFDGGEGEGGRGERGGK